MARKAFQLAFAGQAADDALLTAFQQLEIDDNASVPSTFAIRLGTERDATGRWSRLDDSRFALFAPVSVDAGVIPNADTGPAAGLEPIADGYVTAVAVHVGAKPGDAYVEVRGSDPSVLLSLEEKAVAWPNMSDSDIAQQVVGAYGLSVRATKTAPVRQQNDTLLVQRGTDAQFLRMLARRNGFEFSFRKDRGGASYCYFGPSTVDASPQADLAVAFGTTSNLVRFDLSVSGLRPLSVNATQLDVRNKQESTVEISGSRVTSMGASDLRSLVQRLGSLVQPREAQARLLLLAQPTADATELRAVAQAVRDEAEWLISARGEINSDAYDGVLRAGRPVLVKGVGREYSGTYYVTRVHHIIKSDGTHTQTFEAKRNARDLTGTESFGSAGSSAVSLPAV